MITFRGKGLVAVTKDIADGYVTVNPIFLKPLDAEALEALYKQVLKHQGVVRADKFPHGDVRGIRDRNIKLQKLHSALIIIKNFAKERGMKHLRFL